MEWINPADPTKGFRYMYLSDADYAAVSARAETAVLKAIPLVTEAGALHGPRSWDTTAACASMTRAASLPFAESMHAKCQSCHHLSSARLHGGRLSWVAVLSAVPVCKGCFPVWQASVGGG